MQKRKCETKYRQDCSTKYRTAYEPYYDNVCTDNYVKVCKKKWVTDGYGGKKYVDDCQNVNKPKCKRVQKQRAIQEPYSLWSTQANPSPRFRMAPCVCIGW